MTVNYFVLVVGCLQVVGGAYAFYTGDWRLGVINVCVGIANGTLSTMAR